MATNQYKSLRISRIITDRREKKRSKRVPGMWGRQCASAESIERSLARLRG